MSDGVMAQVPDNHALMREWKAYQETDGFKNSLIWATAENYHKAGAHNAAEPMQPFTGLQREQFVKGAFWACFMAGFEAATKRAAELHEQINPADDDERANRVPGAGAMGAVIEYRDRIRAPL